MIKNAKKEKKNEDELLTHQQKRHHKTIFNMQHCNKSPLENMPMPKHSESECSNRLA